MTDPTKCPCPRCAEERAEHDAAAIERAALRKVRDTLRRPDLGPGTTLRIIGEIVDQALDHDPKETT